ncbi:MAG: hypothetical protein DRP78_01510 [Candidatus Omnitrophota bacterium]|nr:MAG: hypothetical protein DRP78_01510 [Candidatus Omnitrophota bacterium]
MIIIFVINHIILAGKPRPYRVNLKYAKQNQIKSKSMVSSSRENRSFSQNASLFFNSLLSMVSVALFILFIGAGVLGSGGSAVASLDSYIGINSSVMNRENETPVVFESNHKGIDSAFNTEVFRLTGPTGSNALIEDNDSYRNKNPWMHFNNPWSGSGNHFVIVSYGDDVGYINRVMSFDRDNFTISEYRIIPNSPNGQPITPYNRNLWFDPNEELLMYGVTSYGTELYAYNAGDISVTLGNQIILPNSYLLLKDFAESNPLMDAFNQGFMWNDGKTFSYAVKNSNGQTIGIGTYFWTTDPTNGTLNYTDITGWDDFDELWCDRKNYIMMAHANDGNYSHIPSGSYGVIRFDTDGNYVDSWISGNPYFDTGKGSGYGGYWTNRNYNLSNSVFLRNSLTPDTFYRIWPPSSETGTDIRSDSLSIGNSWVFNPSYSNSDYVYGAEYSITTIGPTTKVGQDEIFAIDVTNPGAVSHWKRIARLWNVGGSWDNQPDCYGSPNNDYVMYWSNMEAAGEVNGRWDTFVARIFNGSDITPPTRSNPQPTGTLTSGTTQTTISLTTNETAICKYSTTPNTAYDDLLNSLSADEAGTTHSQIISGLSDGNTYAYYIRCQDTVTPPNQNTDDFNISFSVANVVSDTTPPIRSNGFPQGEIELDTTVADISLSTDENAACKYSSMENTDYADMTNFSATTGTNHLTEVTGLENGLTYNYYVKCRDELNNINTDDFVITFSVASNQGINNPTSTSSSGGRSCFIATAAYGTEMAEEVKVLSRFRDKHLLKNNYGKTFVKMYYKYSPRVADYIRHRVWARDVVRVMLRPLVKVTK